MSAQSQASAVRGSAGLFRLADRGLIRVAGSDRERWLNAMVSNDVASLVPGRERSGCRALLLSRKGMILADFHVLLRPDSLWLDLERPALAETIEALRKHIIADDVTLEDLSAGVGRLSLEGPAARAILESAIGAPIQLSPEAVMDGSSEGVEVVVAAYGWSGEPAYQLFAPADKTGDLRQHLVEAGASCALIEADAEALEILRIEAGRPQLGAELGDDVLPDEAHLGEVVSEEKGCYIGQEIVARLRSRGQVNHLLVGLRFGNSLPAEPSTPLCVEEREIGEVTSSCVSPVAGAIGLGFVRRAHAAAGTELQAGACAAKVVSLPHAGPGFTVRGVDA